MIRNLKKFGLAMVAVLALGVLTAQGASATEHEFRSDGAWTVGEGTAALNLAIGAAGSVKCNAELEDQSGGTKVGEEYLSDTLTVTPRFSECSFAGNPATVKVNHCAFVVDSDLTEGKVTSEKEFANAEIECAEGNQLEVESPLCTITIGPQFVQHAINYPYDTTTSVSGNVSAHGIVVGNLGNKAGCALVPKGAVGTLTGNGTTECFKDEGSVLTGTEKTTPQGKTNPGASTECSIK